MRVGLNPMNEKYLSVTKAYHRIIMPVFIPSLNNYYSESFEVLKLSCATLLQSIHNETLVTIINNNSCKVVTNYLRQIMEEKKIDQLIEFKENKGKVDPVVAVMRSCQEKLITITDCDVLFKNGWQYAVEEIFLKVPHVGMVTPLPAPVINKYFSVWSWYAGITKRCLYKLRETDEESISSFNKSIGVARELSETEKHPFAIIIRGCKAVIGSGHFCATYNKNVVNYIPQTSSGIRFKGAEEQFLDKPVQVGGFLRLATNKGWVFHMGNSVEVWMKQVAEYNKKYIEEPRVICISNGYRFSPILRKVIIKILSNKRLLKFIEKKISFEN